MHWQRLILRFTKRSWATIFALVLAITSHGVELPPGPTSKDDDLRRRIIGVWEDDYQGHRTMTVRKDGTATMVVELKGWKAVLYASRLQFEMIWSIQDGHMSKQTTGGTPAGKVNTILRMMGDRVKERILELSKDRLVLEDQGGKRTYQWRRVKAKDQGRA